MSSCYKLWWDAGPHTAPRQAVRAAMRGQKGHVVLSLGYAAQHLSVHGALAGRHAMQSCDHGVSNRKPRSGGSGMANAKAPLDTEGAHRPVASV